MKKFAFIMMVLMAVAWHTYSQPQCGPGKIMSPAVTKASALSVDLITCSTLVVKWNGSPEQTYTPVVLVIDSTTNTTKDSIAATSNACDFALHCKATFNVKPGMRV